jgi:hypothetical protein
MCHRRHRVNIVPRLRRALGAGRSPADWLYRSLRPQLFAAEHLSTDGIAALLRGIFSFFDTDNSIGNHATGRVSCAVCCTDRHTARVTGPQFFIRL